MRADYRNANFLTIVRIAAALEIDPGELVRGIGVDSLPERRHQLTASELLRERERRAEH
ncbi:hypothetical protein [Ruicaihuangia caeni]|uniref:XRE family transcriptional regulator n=1 Tax=Ruicaihuangia caeni TaxID=3042517 RepID=A0AAW6T194_9MICO|nr:hypothetical protein [Klugiella sp. YN-L-19]MDI2097567.1 hypothetical protein [Klugiella sp. YN-L-19]